MLRSRTDSALETPPGCTAWCEQTHEQSDTERLCLKRIVATHDVDGDPVTVTVERLADGAGPGETFLLIEMLAPLSAAAVYELTSTLIDAGKLLQQARAA